MAAETFAHRYFVAAPAERIYDHLAHPENYVGLSPLVITVHDRANQPRFSGAGGPALSLGGTISLSGLHSLRQSDPVTTTLSQPPAQLISDVDARAGARPIRLQPSAGLRGTWIDETITAQVLLPLLGFVVAEAKRVQVERVQILKPRLEVLAS